MQKFKMGIVNASSMLITNPLKKMLKLAKYPFWVGNSCTEKNPILNLGATYLGVT